MLRAFPMSLTGAASRWLRNKPFGLITTWEDLKTKFLSKYCPPARTAKKMEEINNFHQEPNENLYQAWERFKELLMKCPQQYLTEMYEVVLFYNGLDVPTVGGEGHLLILRSRYKWSLFSCFALIDQMTLWFRD
ncbi:reverse transcriptase domain-containing protein [Tanacetum coccineum]